MVNQTRKAHFVPATYLQAFADGKGRRAKIKRCNTEGQMLASHNVEDVCHERDLYMFPNMLIGNFASSF
jgi:hypothetical protein